MKSDHAIRDVLLGALTLALAVALCVYGFTQVVPLALAHIDVPTTTNTGAAPSSKSSN